MPKFTTTDASDAANLQYSNEDYAFANSVINDIKRQQRLPLQINPEDVFGAIQNQADIWYDQWPSATQDDQLTFECDVLANPQKYLDKSGVDQRFKLMTNQVLMPSAVYGVYQLFYSSSGYANRSLLNYANWSLEWILLSSSAGNVYPQYGVETFMGSVYCLNLLNSLSKQPVMHKFNRDSHILQVYDLGYNTGFITALVARCLPISTFYGNPYFRRYIMGHVIQARADQIELFGTVLPGDLQVNVGVLRNRADKLLEDVNKMMETENGTEFYALKT